MEVIAACGSHADIHAPAKTQVLILWQEANAREVGDDLGDFRALGAEVVDDNDVQVGIDILRKHGPERIRKMLRSVVAENHDRDRWAAHDWPPRSTRHQTA